MFDWDVVIVGGGPAGLAAGLYLSRANRRTLLLDKESLGGYIRNVESIENYPGFADGISGAALASAMVYQAAKYGLRTEMGEVTGLELFSGCRYVGCADGTGYTANVVVIAGGSRHKKLGVPGEESLRGKGIFTCAFCDGGHFADRVVAVCGGGDAGVTEALYMAKIARKVILIEAEPALTATAVLRERVSSHPKVELLCGMRVMSINGNGRVEALELEDSKSGVKTKRDVEGVLVHIGLEPNTGYLDGIIPLDGEGQIVVNEKMETGVPHVFAAGDIRSGSPRQVVTAVGDGATAAIFAEQLLQIEGTG
jgi:thioredoxin reductase (NADPH)